jgi:hypothetical protein
VALLAIGASIAVAGPAAAGPSATTAVADNWLMRSPAVHWNSHGAAGSVNTRQSVGSQDNRGLELVGKYDLSGKLAGDGRVADVSAKGNWAYLTMFYEPVCGRGGVQIVDISNPAAPKAGAYIPSHTDTFSGEGSQVVSINTSAFKGDVLVYQKRVVPELRPGRGRHQPRRRDQPAPAEEAGRGRR